MDNKALYEKGGENLGILIEDLTKKFEDKVVLDAFSAAFPDKGVIWVRGASGIGKTTLLRMICGLDRDYTGKIDGVGTVSYAFQEHRLFPWLSALSNVALSVYDKPGKAEYDAAEKILMRLGFKSDDMQLKPAQLSGGMKQRVSLARAFLYKSDILILDEPTKELDANLVATVREMIKDAASERAVILVTHDNALSDLECELEIEIPSL